MTHNPCYSVDGRERFSGASWKGEHLAGANRRGNTATHKLRTGARYIPIVPLFLPG